MCYLLGEHNVVAVAHQREVVANTLYAHRRHPDDFRDEPVQLLLGEVGFECSPHRALGLQLVDHLGGELLPELAAGERCALALREDTAQGGREE